MVRLELPPGSPHVDDPVAGMFRALGNPIVEDPAIDRSRLASIEDDERRTLLVSLATTIARSSYHHQRFHFLLGTLNERRRLAGGSRSHDDATRFAVFEAASMLGAIRGAVDEVVFIAARRNGGSGSEADGWRPHGLIAGPLAADKDYEDIRRLRDHATWFLELNDYRNALVHRGSRHTVGSPYFPIGDTLPEALNPKFNSFLIPDRESLRRAARPHLWTYVQANRIEDLVTRIWDGFVALLTEIGAVWGAAPTPQGTVPVERRPNMVLTVDQPAFFVWGDGIVYVGCFTMRALARAFAAQFGSSPLVGPVVPIRPFLVGGSPRYFLSIPAGTLIAEAGMRGFLKVAVDPTCDPVRKTINYQREVGNLSLEALASHDLSSKLFEIPAETFPGFDEIFVIRRLVDA